MSALLTSTRSRTASALGGQEREIMARIDRGGLSIPEAELRYQLGWDDATASCWTCWGSWRGAS